MLSDEEKKAIEYLKQNSIPILRYDNFGNILSPLYYGTFEKETILNLIEKLSKEIEELTNEVMEKELIIDGMKEDRRIAVEEIQEQYYVSKDKIKAKIEELQEDIKYSANPLSIDNSKFVIKVLQSLLEKE